MSEAENVEDIAYQAMQETVSVDEVKRRVAPFVVSYLRRLSLDTLVQLASEESEERFSVCGHILFDASRAGVVTTASQIDGAVRAVSETFLKAAAGSPTVVDNPPTTRRPM